MHDLTQLSQPALSFSVHASNADHRLILQQISGQLLHSLWCPELKSAEANTKVNCALCSRVSRLSSDDDRETSTVCAE